MKKCTSITFSQTQTNQTTLRSNFSSETKIQLYKVTQISIKHKSKLAQNFIKISKCQRAYKAISKYLKWPSYSKAACNTNFKIFLRI